MPFDVVNEMKEMEERREIHKNRIFPQAPAIGYLQDYIAQPILLKSMVEDAAKVIKASGVAFDAIACRGVSGMLVAVPLSIMMGKPLIIVRKEKSDNWKERTTHSKYDIEFGIMGTAVTYIIVDDLIDTGDTIRAIIDGIDLKANKRNLHICATAKANYECVGIFTFHKKTTLGYFEHCHKNIPHWHGEYAEWT